MDWEQLLIRNTLLVTVNTNDDKNLACLNNLASQLHAISTFQFGTSVAPQETSVPDFVPCEVCDQILAHQSDCDGEIKPQPTLPSQLFSLNQQAPRTPLKLTASTIDAALFERLSLFGDNAARMKYLCDCLLRLEDQRKLVSSSSKDSGAQHEFLVGLKQKIGVKVKELLQRDAQEKSKSSLLEWMETNQGPSPFLGFLVNEACSEEEVKTLFRDVLKKLGDDMRSSTRSTNMLTNNFSRHLAKLQTLTQYPRVVDVIGEMISSENRFALENSAGELENSSLLCGFLRLSSIVTPFHQNFVYTSLLSSYPNAPRDEFQMLQGNIKNCLAQLQAGVHATLKKLLSSPRWKESVVSWVANLMLLNEMRVTIDYRDQLSYELSLLLSSPGVLVNLAQVLLVFTKPFTDISQERFKGIERGADSLYWRIDWGKEPKLRESKAKQSQESAQGPLNFMSEMFYLTYYAIHVSIIPTMTEYLHFHTILQQMKTRIEQLKVRDGPYWNTVGEGIELNKRFSNVCATLDSFIIHLLDDGLLDAVMRFFHFSVHWMLHVIDGKERDSVLSVIPQFFVLDLCSVWLFLSRFKGQLLANQHAEFPGAFVRLIVMLLNPPTLARSPVFRAKVVEVLAEIVEMRKASESRSSGTSLGWNGGDLYSQISGLYFGVMTRKGDMERTLLNGVCMIYIDSDVVEGLDVDKQVFDKYTVRTHCASVFHSFSQTPTFNQTLVELSHSTSFAKFIRTVVNDCIHLLEDALGRLIDIKTLESAMSDVSAWNSQDPSTIDERVRYYEIQQRSARGFLALAISVLELLVKLVGEKEVRAVFVGKEMIGRVVGMLIHSFDTLCGPKCSNLKVNNPEKYNFSPKNLLGKIALATLAFADSEEFLATVARDPDYNPQVMAKALYFLQRESILPTQQSEHLKRFIEQVDRHLAASIGGSDFGRETETWAEERTPEWSETQEMELEQFYKASLADQVFDTCEMRSPEGDYNHHYNTNINTASKVSPAKMQKLMKECELLCNHLPLSNSCSIFVRGDAERLDVMKAIIVGPSGTPYSLGCFEFHVYFPPEYPFDPPLCNLETTGNGTVRFNPNLYNCGKVCLSLLGTWHGDDKTSKWNPSSSTLHQVLLSVQAIIMVEQPYFNEPAYEAQRGTKEGQQRSSEYNENIRLATLRHAIITQIKNPSKGFEEAITSHFKIIAPKLLRQAQAWLDEASPMFKDKFTKAVADLKNELRRLKD